MNAPQRKIIHIDMDAFYAAVEQRDHPEYRGRPICVGGRPDSRGVVATCSYEARAFGIHSAMPSAQAHRLCPEALFVRPRFEAYREVSRQVQAIFRRHTERVEPLSLDEAYLDVTGSAECQGSATLIARAIQRQIREATGLTGSAGVSYNKLLAKLASDMDKPDGLYVITPDAGPDFVRGLPIGRFHGVGRATEARMKAAGIHTGADLLRLPLDELTTRFGKAGRYYYRAARGIDERPVVSHRERKSIGAETTFDRDLRELDAMIGALEAEAGRVAGHLERRRLAARTLTIKVKYADFRQVTRSASPGRPIRDFEQMRPLLPVLLARTEAPPRPVRLLGVSVSGLEPGGAIAESVQASLL